MIRECPRTSMCGFPYVTWETYVPRLRQEWLDSIVYLYETVDQARAGERIGATAFIASVPPEDPELDAMGAFGHHYVVTNRHCVEPRRDLVGRVNRRGQGFDVVELPFEVWRPHPHNDDVTVAPLEIRHPFWQYASVNRGMMLDRHKLRMLDFGPGDETFFIGRYVDLDGEAHNVPTMRSGIVSAFPSEPIIQSERGGHPQESFLVEARSLSGFSGSPVFVTYSAVIEKSAEGDMDSMPYTKHRDESPIALLGLDWGHHQWWESVRRGGVKTTDCVPLNSGMMKVVPAWKLLEILELDDTLVTLRHEQEQKTKDGLAKSPVAQDFVDEQPPPTEPDEEFDRFEDLTRRLVNTPKPKQP